MRSSQSVILAHKSSLPAESLWAVVAVGVGEVGYLLVGYKPSHQKHEWIQWVIIKTEHEGIKEARVMGVVWGSGRGWGQLTLGMIKMYICMKLSESVCVCVCV